MLELAYGGTLMEQNRKFLYPRYKYRGEATPENIAFDGQLQEFAAQVNMIAGLHTGGKLSSQESYQRLKQYWKQVKTARQQWGIGSH
ncbi:hypothetical protein ACL6C3_11280 [Capilliphycus salinus ALCB114379]|uniref:DUF7219 family protein n=1 Tax=Capilliphycus salinus TaxID=2768948 RepID=UPI0039A5E379